MTLPVTDNPFSYLTLFGAAAPYIPLPPTSSNMVTVSPPVSTEMFSPNSRTSPSVKSATSSPTIPSSTVSPPVTTSTDFTIKSLLEADMDAASKLVPSPLALQRLAATRPSLPSSTVLPLAMQQRHVFDTAKFLWIQQLAHSNLTPQAAAPSLFHPPASSLRPTKKRKLGRNPRIPFTQQQIDCLEKKYTESRYLSSMDVVSLSKQLDLSEARVKIWFQNRRARERRDKRGGDTSMLNTELSPPIPSDVTSTWQQNPVQIMDTTPSKQYSSDSE